jgi:hypothetical protein
VGDIQQGSLNIEAIPMVAGYMQNIGLVNATTTNAADSIKVTGADGQSLSVRNLGWIVLPGASAGQLQVMPVSADISINLTGAHWGLGTFGDQSDYPLHVYAINDASLLKWGVGAVQGLSRIDGADDQATATNATSVDHILVNSALSASANCREIGWFRANFDDTGGAAEDLWAVQTGAMDILLGPAPSLRKPFTPTFTGFGSVTNISAYWSKKGDQMEFSFRATPGTTTGVEARLSLPSGLASASTISTLYYAGTCQRVASSTNQIGITIEASVAYFTFSIQGSANGLTKVNGDGMITTGEVFSGFASIPITGWDGNVT